MIERTLERLGLNPIICCTSTGDHASSDVGEVVHELSSDVIDFGSMPVLLPSGSGPDEPFVDGPLQRRRKGAHPRATAPITPRQRSIRDRVQLPALHVYPVPPGCAHDEPEETKLLELTRFYEEFVVDLLRGFHMTQLTSSQDYSDIHCQILEDLQTLKVDQGSGCIIEFPLAAVSRVYRIVKNNDQWSSPAMHPPSLPPGVFGGRAEHIVVVEFMRRKLAFVFDEIVEAQNFLMCLELLIRRAQECRLERQQAKSGDEQVPTNANHVFLRVDTKPRLHKVDVDTKSNLVSCSCRSNDDDYLMF